MIVAPLLTGDSQETRAEYAEVQVTLGAFGESGTPAPLTTSNGSDQSPPYKQTYCKKYICFSE